MTRVTRRTAVYTLARAAMASTLPIGAPVLQPGLCGSTDVAGFDSFCFIDGAGVRHQVYVAGKSGPPVLLLHELPGLIEPDLRAARCIADMGYRVVTPLFFGAPGQSGGLGAIIRYTRRHCGREQFACGEANVTSPIVGWLAELGRAAQKTWGEGRGVAVVGMCLTGAFPIAMLRDPLVVAGVLCQPTVPFRLIDGFTRGAFADKTGLGVDPKDLEYVRTSSTAPLLGLRYTSDWRSPAPRFRRLTEIFGTRFSRMDFIGGGHSTLGSHFCTEALEEVRSLLNQTLRTVPDSAVAPFPRRSRSSLDEVRFTDCCPPGAASRRS